MEQEQECQRRGKKHYDQKRVWLAHNCDDVLWGMSPSETDSEKRRNVLALLMRCRETRSELKALNDEYRRSAVWISNVQLAMDCLRKTETEK